MMLTQEQKNEMVELAVGEWTYAMRKTATAMLVQDLPDNPMAFGVCLAAAEVTVGQIVLGMMLALMAIKVIGDNELLETTTEIRGCVQEKIDALIVGIQTTAAGLASQENEKK